MLPNILQRSTVLNNVTWKMTIILKDWRHGFLLPCSVFPFYHLYNRCTFPLYSTDSNSKQHDVQHSSDNNLCHSKPHHISVMTKEALQFLNPQDNQVIIDMTFGAGGHSQQILNTARCITLYGLDRDPDAYNYAVDMKKSYGDQLIPLLGKFSDLPKLLHKHDVKENTIDGIILDAGCSSMQFDSSERGFSLSRNGPLDMRMDKDRFPNHPTAADVVNTLDYPNLVKIFKIYGEERFAKRIAQAIIDSRFMMKRICTTRELAEIVSSVVGDNRLDKLQRKAHCATKIFQGLRIFVNNELNELNYALELAYHYLKPGGRIIALTFHSLEDRIVKRHIMDIDIDEPISSSLGQKYKNAALWHSKQNMDTLMQKRWFPLNKKVILPSEEEVAINPRSRSAKLRAAMKL